ncbi:putative Xaa-Pro aminopeptidase P [Cladobotryum mycophilum]|uniref:Probable Xaa-Pro aminopeptidase P n=1 Tax=Cladobotryum mycophilum TaxID=491253 RepID=A0ABR0SYY7_9HYPO
MAKADTTSKLAKLRLLMKERNVHVYIIPSEDSHSSEYIAECDARREFISGFTGSAGCAVVTEESAALATDGRYFNQAAHQLDDNWTLLKQGLQDVPTWQEWAAEQSAGGKTVAVDSTLITGSAAKKLVEKIRKSGGSDLLPLDDNLVDIVWGQDRPARPLLPIKVLDEKFSGKSVQNKLSELRAELEKKHSPGFFISMLDEIAWLFNLRGSDIPYNPVFFSYAAVTPQTATLYIDESKLDDSCKSHLAANDVQVKPYGALFADARQLHQSTEGRTETGNIGSFLISNKGSWALKRALGGDSTVEEIRSPVGDAKAIKNDTELEGMRACHIRDGAALIEYFAWLEDQLVAKRATLDEVQAADKLEELRSKHQHFVGLSFPTISSTGANAAVIHYGPERGNCAVLDPEAVYLCDSGAQYLDGTTDTTRTLHFGKPTDNEREAYTLVLKGHIGLDMAIFPKGTTGFALDSLARQHLWMTGLDYRHGTGHGVGSFLNVHEGPIGIGTRVQYTEVPLAAGNVISNEPGYYEDGSFGIRIENIVMVKEAKTKYSFGDKPFLGFEHVTMVPYCKNLVDTSMLSDAEKSWLNAYNAEVLEKTQGYFEKDPLTMAWLKRETEAIYISIFYLIGLFDLWDGISTLFISSGGAYCIAKYFRGSPYMPWVGFVFVMGHMSVSHIQRQIAASPSSVDITGAQMVLVMKLSAFCWNVADGQLPADHLSDFQKDRALNDVPALLDYTAYYRRWIDTSMFDVPAQIDPSKKPPVRKKRKIPRSGTPATIKAITGLIWIGLFVVLSESYSPALIVKDSYGTHGFPRRVWIMYMTNLVTRFKYYGVWSLTEGSCILAGLGYNGVDPITGKVSWNRLQNIDPWGVETAQNPRGYLAGWNMNTNNWLRNYIYLRVTPRGKKPGFRASLMTFVTSAFWHGFYPGYYLAFVLASLIQTSAKNFRRHVRPFFLDPISGNSLPKKKYYDFASYLVTQVVFSFATLPFLVLAFDDSIRTWSRVYFYGFVGTVVSIAFFATPGKVILKKQLEKRQGKASVKLSRSLSTDSLTGKEPILGISKDPEQDINEAVGELKAELEAFQKKKSS